MRAKDSKEFTFLNPRKQVGQRPRRSLGELHDKGIIGDALYNWLKCADQEIRAAIKRDCKPKAECYLLKKEQKEEVGEENEDSERFRR